MSLSRRAAREAALKALYEVEIGGAKPDDALERARVPRDENDEVAGEALSDELARYAATLVHGVLEHRANLDQNLAGYVRDYDYSRLAAVDRNILRIGAFEILFLPDMPPAVSINEAIEIAKRYSTAESGKFVNGVLARLLRDSPKAEWKPPSKQPVEQVVRDPEPEVVTETVEAGSEEGKDAMRFGQWTIRSEDE